MHIVVVGAGAIGSAIAAGMALACCDVTLIARGQRLKEMMSGALELERGGAMFQASPSVSAWKALTRPADVVFLCVKMGDLTDALDHLAPRFAPGATVITLQNGVEAHEHVAARFSDAHVVASRVHGFFEMDGARVRHVGVPASILYGCTQGDAALAHAAVQGALSGSGFAAEVTDDIVRALWEKLLIAACAGGVAAALDIPAGQIFRYPAGRAMLDQAMHEVVTLAAARSVALDGADVERAIDVMMQFPPNATTSLQRDLAAGRASEYDALVGTVVRLARTHAVPHPMFAQIDRTIRDRADMPISAYAAADDTRALPIRLDKRL